MLHLNRMRTSGCGCAQLSAVDAREMINVALSQSAALQHLRIDLRGNRNPSISTIDMISRGLIVVPPSSARRLTRDV